MTPVDVAGAALCEAGRQDLAQMIVWFDDEHGAYIEVPDYILTEADWALVDRAETIARMFIGLPPYPRGAT
jgi:hypothetical protein